MRHILLLILFLSHGSLIANPLFKGFNAEYSVSHNDTFLGVSNRQLVVRDNGKKLDYASTTIPKGLVALFISDRFMEHSLTYVTPRGLQPRRYEYQRTGGKKEFTFQAGFDWSNKRVHLSNNPQAQSLLPNTHDLLSFQLSLMDGLYKGQRKFIFHIVDHKRVQKQTLEYTKSQTISSSHGKLDVLELAHRAEKSHYKFTFWCARQLHYLPIVIRKIEQDGDIVELKLKKFNRKSFWLSTDKQEENEY